MLAAAQALSAGWRWAAGGLGVAAVQLGVTTTRAALMDKALATNWVTLTSTPVPKSAPPKDTCTEPSSRAATIAPTAYPLRSTPNLAALMAIPFFIHLFVPLKRFTSAFRSSNLADSLICCHIFGTVQLNPSRPSWSPMGVVSPKEYMFFSCTWSSGIPVTLATCSMITSEARIACILPGALMVVVCGVWVVATFLRATKCWNL
mmetsp:Transcript_142882/g.319535  ORF Transcript_142882/g.319535 Transcript_142882/m.319535 type:complete len:204 (-) Transcript_142882:1687-2298(-)